MFPAFKRSCRKCLPVHRWFGRALRMQLSFPSVMHAILSRDFTIILVLEVSPHIPFGTLFSIVFNLIEEIHGVYNKTP
jgi:hypothetical protein